jgi:hypothetical protein
MLGYHAIHQRLHNTLGQHDKSVWVGQRRQVEDFAADTSEFWH